MSEEKQNSKFLWYQKLGIAAAILWLVATIPLAMAEMDNVAIQVWLFDFPFSIVNLYNGYFAYSSVLYIYAIWLQRPKEFSFFHPAWWFATSFGLGYISRYFGKWWNYVICVLPFALGLACFFGYIPWQTIILILFLAIAIKGSGTVGTFFACYLLVIFALLPRVFEFSPIYMIYGFVAITFATIILGIWATEIYVRRTKISDPSEVVIDEVAGLFLGVLLAVGIYALLLSNNEIYYVQRIVFAPMYLVTMFFLFRLFDIFKPYPIKKLEKLKPAGWGVMADDLMAGVYSVIVFYIAFFILDYAGVFKQLIGAGVGM